MRYLILSIRCFFLTETKKKIAILLITILLLGLCISLPVIFVTAASNKARLENSYLDRDRSRIFCNKNEKIGQAIIDYTTENNKNEDENDIFKNNKKYSIFLWCTSKPNNSDIYKVYSPVYSLFYLTYKNIMNLQNFSVNEVGEIEIYSKEWNKKYDTSNFKEKYKNFDNYFIN